MFAAEEIIGSEWKMTMAEYNTTNKVPPLVKRAVNLAQQIGEMQICSDQTGRLLQLLTCQLPSGVIGEVGSGSCVATAWIASALSPGTSFFSVQEDPAVAASAGSLFAPQLNIRVIQGNWREFLQYWHFSLFFANQASTRADEPELFLQALRDGGMLVLDGLIPEHRLPAHLRDEPNPLREFWLNDKRVYSSEIMVSADESVILATKSN